MLPDTAANVRVSPDEVIGPANRMSSSSVLPAISFRCFFNPRPLHRAVDAVSVYPTYRKPFDMIFEWARMSGLGGIEPPTSPLSGLRSSVPREEFLSTSL
jgi:hypothetical protein